MKLNFIPMLVLGATMFSFGQASAQQSSEVRLKNPYLVPNKHLQATLRADDSWQSFIQENGNWMVVFNEETGFPQRAFGNALEVSGNTVLEKAYDFIHNHMGNLPVAKNELVPSSDNPVYSTRKHHFVYFHQEHNGMKVENSHLLVKFDKQERVISFGGDVFQNIEVKNLKSEPSAATLKKSAVLGLQDVKNVEVSGEQSIMAIKKENREVEFRKVVKATVFTMNENRIPGEYITYVDAETGKIISRTNQVDFCSNENHDHGHNGEQKAQKKAMAAGFSFTGTGHRDNPSIAAETLPMPHAQAEIGGVVYASDKDGNFTDVNITGSATGKFFLQGKYTRIRNSQEGDAIPQFETMVDASTSNVSMDNNSIIEERSAYYHVNRIHDYMKTILPNFTAMDNPITTNVQVTPAECNAFYNGSLNFYLGQPTCLSYALVADVVYHEYGHGINRLFYTSIGRNFQNGGMNEGYADVWAMMVLEDPILGNGGNPTDEDNFIRRYDENPKIFPKDLVGEVHADGEIIAGAWWDLYLNFGRDMSKTMDLFALAFPGAQAIYGNGDEGRAFTDVLIDVLEADDDDSDIFNGTPNGDAIADAFNKHGISLLSNAKLDHTNQRIIEAGQPVVINAKLTLESVVTDYLESVVLCYAGSDADVYSKVPMEDKGGNNYSYTIPNLPNGTLLKYYMAVEDKFGNTSSITPIGANEADANVPYFTLVGFNFEGADDMDFFDGLFGNWTVGYPDDNATTGQWEFAEPIGSYSTPGDASTISAPATQTTPDGFSCYVTQNSQNESAGVGERDVDGGKTSLGSPVFELSSYTNPVLTYQRWYINNPPTGANPSADWWQVEITNDGENWVYVENTKQSNKEWRYYALRVRDYVELTDNVQLRFTASDSIRPGQNLDGGSLVEAGVDDLSLYEASAYPASVKSLSASTEVNVSIYPNPVKDLVYLRTEENLNNMQVTVFDQTGRVVRKEEVDLEYGLGKLNVNDLPSGLYSIEVRSGNRMTNQKLVIQ